MIAASTLVLGATAVLPGLALASGCTPEAEAPASVSNSIIRATTTAEGCSGTENLDLKSTLVRVRGGLPDVNVASTTDSGAKTSYEANAFGCDEYGQGARGYKTVGEFIDGPGGQATSGITEHSCV